LFRFVKRDERVTFVGLGIIHIPHLHCVLDGLLAKSGVKPGVQKFFDWFSLLEMLLDDRLHLLWFDSTIPDFIRQNLHRHAQIALSLTPDPDRRYVGKWMRQKSCQHLC
jgi:hypothetical protein